MLAQRLLGSYGSLNLPDPKVFITELVAVLRRYPKWVGDQAITDAKRASPTFVPSVPQVENACREAVRVATYAREWEAQSLRQLEDRGQSSEAWSSRHLANVFVPLDAPQYAAMVERAKTGDPMEWRLDEHRSGIWVALGWLRGDMGGLGEHSRNTVAPVTPEQFREKHGVSEDEWKSLPELPEHAEYWRGLRRSRVA